MRQTSRRVWCVRGALGLGALAIASLATACGARTSPELVRPSEPEAAEGERSGEPARPGDGATGGGPVAAEPGDPAADRAGASGGAQGAGAEASTREPADGPSGPGGAQASASAPLPAAGGEPAAPRDPGITDEVVRIGNLTTYSGPVAGQFDGGPQGAAAYFRMRNEQGGWRGRRFEFITVDDRGDGTYGRSQATRLVEDEEIFAFVGNTTLAEWGSAAYLREQGVPAVGTTPSSIGCTEPNQVPCITSDEWWQGTNNDRYLCEEGIMNEVAVFWIAIDTSRKQAQGGIAGLEHSGCEVVFEFEGAPAQPDYTAAIAQARAAGADSVYAVMDVFSNARLRRDMFRQGWEPPYFGFTNYDERYLDQTGPAANGTYAPMPLLRWMYDEEHPRLREYLQTFRRYFPDGFPEELFASYGWVSARLFVEQGLERLGDTLTREAVLDALYQTRDWTADGLLQPVNVFPKDRVEGEQPWSPCTGLVRVEDEEFVLEARDNCEEPIPY